MNTLNIIRLAMTIALLPACLISSSNTRAQEPYEVFFPLLVNLPGWTGTNPTGAAQQFPNGLSVNAIRIYERGTDQLWVSIIVLPIRVHKPYPAVSFENNERRVTFSMVEGFQVFETVDFKTKATGAVVELGTNGFLNLLAPRGIANGDVGTIAKRFDWKALDTNVRKFVIAN